MSSRSVGGGSVRHHYSHRATTSALLARIERLEAAGTPDLVARTSAAAPVANWPARPSRAEGSQSPPLSAEGRARAAALQEGSPDLVC